VDQRHSRQGTGSHITRIARLWFLIPFVLSVAIGLFVNDSSQVLRRYAQAESPAPEINPVRSESGAASGRPLAALFAVALSKDLPPRSLHPPTMNPVQLLLLKPANNGDDWTGCFYLFVMSTAAVRSSLVLFAPPGATPLSVGETKRLCYSQEYSSPVALARTEDTVSGLAELSLSLSPPDQTSGLLAAYGGFRWRQVIETDEGFGRQRLLLSYDSGLPSTFDRTGLQAVEDYHMDFTNAINDASTPPVRESGVHIVVAPQDANDERLQAVTPVAAWNSGVRAAWRTTADDRRLDIVAVFDNAAKRRQLEAELQRSGLVLSVAIPLVAGLLGVRLHSVLNSEEGLNRSRLLIMILVWAGLAIVIRSGIVPPLIDPLIRWSTGS
jgi:hypothetical protein